MEYSELVQMKEKIRKETEEKYLKESKKRLKNILETKLRTTFIGALDIFERTFGYLWGKDSPEPLDDTQQEMFEIWQEVRKRILDQGNNQMRAAQNEIDQYTIRWNRYTMVLPVKPNKTIQNS